jgi:hypothetical protein
MQRIWGVTACAEAAALLTAVACREQLSAGMSCASRS